MGMGGYMEEVLECLNGSTISTQAPIPDAKLVARVYQIDLHCRLPVLRQGQPDGRESCIVLESGPTRSLVAKLPTRLSLVVLHCR